MAIMHIDIIKATLEQTPLLASLLELYIYDFTEFCKFDIGDDGFYGYKDLPLYWTEPTRVPYVIYVDKKIAGFVLVKQELSVSDNTMVWDIAEFFVMKRYKRLGVGTQAVHKVWALFPGPWQVRVLVGNPIACAFWRHAIEKFTSIPSAYTTIKETNSQDPSQEVEWRIYAFESKLLS